MIGRTARVHPVFEIGLATGSVRRGAVKTIHCNNDRLIARNCRLMALVAMGVGWRTVLTAPFNNQI